MKIRYGFVSNSSSSSFVCVGFKLSETDLAEYLESEDRLAEVIDDEYGMVVHDGESGIVYYGINRMIEDYCIEELDLLKELKEGETLAGLEKRLADDARELFNIPEDVKLSLSVYAGMIPS